MWAAPGLTLGREAARPQACSTPPATSCCSLAAEVRPNLFGDSDRAGGLYIAGGGQLPGLPGGNALRASDYADEVPAQGGDALGLDQAPGTVQPSEAEGGSNGNPGGSCVNATPFVPPDSSCRQLTSPKGYGGAGANVIIGEGTPGGGGGGGGYSGGGSGSAFYSQPGGLLTYYAACGAAGSSYALPGLTATAVTATDGPYLSITCASHSVGGER